jgi:hypothetical protein
VTRSTITNSFLLRIADQHLHHEAVDLRLGQWIRAFGLDRVLCGHDQERLGHLVRLAGDRHLILLHHFQERTLHFRRRAIDLVGEEQIREHRSERGGELAGLLVVDARADQIGGHEVGRELDAAERAVDRARQRLDRQRLGEPWHTFDQKVTVGEDRDQHALQKVILADDDLLHFIENALHRRGRVRVARLGGIHTFLPCWFRKMPARTAKCRSPTRRSRSERQSRCR